MGIKGIDNHGRRHKFTLIHGSGGMAPEPGPITRLGLWDRFEVVSPRLWAFVVFAKCALLATLLYCYFI